METPLKEVAVYEDLVAPPEEMEQERETSLSIKIISKELCWESNFGTDRIIHRAPKEICRVPTKCIAT